MADEQREGRVHRKRLTREEVRAVALKIEERGERASTDALRAEFGGRGGNTMIHEVAREVRDERMQSLARAPLDGDLADPVRVATDGRCVVLQVPVALPLDSYLVEHIMNATPGELQLGSVRVLLRAEPLRMLQEGLKKYKPT